MTPTEHDTCLLALEQRLRASQRLVEARLRAANRNVAPEYLPKLLEHPEALQALIVEHESAYTGWSRYRLVTSSEGHIHGDTCRTWKPSTKTVIVPTLSGLTPEAVVERLGSLCCSVCTPAAAGGKNVPIGLVNVLLRRGTEAFDQALARRISRV